MATINRDAPVTISLADLKYEGDDLDQLTDFYERMNFKSFLAKLAVDDDGDNQEQLAKINYQVLTKDNVALLKEFKDEVSFHLEMATENYHTSPILGFAIGHGDKWYATNDISLLTNPDAMTLLTSSTIAKNVFDAKRTYVGLYRESIELKKTLILICY